MIVVCPFVLVLVAIVSSVLLRYTDSDCPFGIFKLFLQQDIYDENAVTWLSSSSLCTVVTTVVCLFVPFWHCSFWSFE